MYPQTNFGHDALGRRLEGKLRGASEWALDHFTKEGADLDALMDHAGRSYRLSLPDIIREALWVEYKPAGNGRTVMHSEPDRILVHVPLSGAAELVNDVGHGIRHDAPRVEGDELVVVENRQLTYFPEKVLDASAARKVGEALRAHALQVAEGLVAEVGTRSAEIDRYNTALETALQAQRARVENARLYRAELEAGIGLPEARPRAEEAAPAGEAPV